VTSFGRRGLPRPIYNGMPVPWTAPVRGGVPVLGRFGLRRIAEAELEGLCEVCGLRLTDPVFFFRAPVGDGSHIVGDLIPTGLHRRCARLTLAHCPHLWPADGPESIPLDLWRAEVGTLAR